MVNCQILYHFPCKNQSCNRRNKCNASRDVSSFGTFSYKRVNPEEKNNYFVDIYKFVLEFDESDVKTQEEEVSGFAIADLNEIKRYADEGIFLHYDSIRQAFEE